MAYSITINSSADARSLAAEKGYNIVFAKGVATNNGTEFNTAWFTLNPNDIGDSITVSWDVTTYSATNKDYYTRDCDNIEVDHEIVDLETGGAYHVDANGVMGANPTRRDEPAPSRERPFTFNNYYYGGPEGGYYPVLLAQDPAGNKVPFWASGRGMAFQVRIARWLEACPNNMARHIPSIGTCMACCYRSHVS
jgi:hypothetical protein